MMFDMFIAMLASWCFDDFETMKRHDIHPSVSATVGNLYLSRWLSMSKNTRTDTAWPILWFLSDFFLKGRSLLPLLLDYWNVLVPCHYILLSSLTLVIFCLFMLGLILHSLGSRCIRWLLLWASNIWPMVFLSNTMLASHNWNFIQFSSHPY